MVETQESITAKLCSFARAYHSNFVKEKIFDDYLAYDLMGKEEYDEIGQLVENNFDTDAFDNRRTFNGNLVYPVINRFIAPIPLSRGAFAEQELLNFSRLNSKCQYVICGAGMDSFAFRNDNESIQIYEIDHPDTQRYKLDQIDKLEWNILKNVKYIPVDFSTDDMVTALKDAGFDDSIPTFFAILGVTYYLTVPIFKQTIAKISRISTGGSRLVFDFPDETTFRRSSDRVYQLTQITAKLGEPMQHGVSVEEIRQALSESGFIIRTHETPKDIQRLFFGNRTDKLTAFENIHFILAEKRL
ncbi:MAG: class I SAM-dependent methyltransferase [Ruminococcus sp.]|nr:class I SAM-dependent methyltransferase [Ruminococcus sp.]